MELIHCETFKRIKLSNLAEHIIGRRNDSDNKKRKISRSQISVIPNLQNQEVVIKNLGNNPIKVNGIGLKSCEKILCKVNSTVKFGLPGNLNYNISLLNTSQMNCLRSEDFQIMHNLREEVMGIHSDLGSQWRVLDNGKLMMFSNQALKNNHGSTYKVAAFDMDGTLIKTKSGKIFPVDENDWLFYSDKVVNELRKRYLDGFQIVIFSNQGGIALGSTNKKKISTKIENILNNLKIPVQVYLATGYDFYRKPCPGMWYSYLMINGVDVDYDESFYVGDAAGRSKTLCLGKVRKKDHSNADRLFARNIKIKFLTPEELFLGQPPESFKEPDFDPNNLPLKKHDDYNLMISEPEVIIMVGSPGSGKSHFVNHYLIVEGYVSISRDVLGTWQNCIKAMTKYLDLGKKMVIDNTNPTIEVREKFIKVANNYNVKVRCFVMESSIEHCKHNNKFRVLTDKDHVIVSDVIINEYWKKYESPQLDEGFKEIVKVPFIPNFASQTDHHLYKMYLC